MLLGRDRAALLDVAAAIKARTARVALVVPCDLARPDSVVAACDAVLSAYPAIDILVNNGAPWLPGNLTDLADAEIATTIAAAVTGTILVAKGLLPGLRRSAAADIVSIVSTAGWLGWDTGGASAAFHAAKHGQSGFSDRLRHEVKGEGIRVAALYPPDFDDSDPLSSDWHAVRDPAKGENLTNREVVSTVLFVLTAPRTCTFPVVILDNMRE